METPTFSEQIYSCGFGHQDKDLAGSFLLSTDPLNFESISAKGLEPKRRDSVQVPGLYTHEMNAEENQCVAAVDFEWGRFSVDYLGREEKEEKDLCSEPIKIIESLILQAGGISGT